jgi:hypothetical protein
MYLQKEIRLKTFVGILVSDEKRRIRSCIRTIMSRIRNSGIMFFSGFGSLQDCTCLLSPVQTWRAGSRRWRAVSTSGPAWRGSPSGTLFSSSASRPNSGNNSDLPRSVPFHHSVKYRGCCNL